MMNEKQIIIMNATILDDKSLLSLMEFCQACHVEKEVIIEMVEQGIIEAKGKTMSEWHFNSAQLRRSRTALRLQHDLDVNIAGTAIILDLIEELQALRRKIRILGR